MIRFPYSTPMARPMDHNEEKPKIKLPYPVLCTRPSSYSAVSSSTLSPTSYQDTTILATNPLACHLTESPSLHGVMRIRHWGSSRLHSILRNLRFRTGKPEQTDSHGEPKAGLQSWDRVVFQGMWGGRWSELVLKASFLREKGKVMYGLKRLR